MDILWKIFFITILCIAGYGIYLGASKKAVFYMNKNDLLISFSGWIAAFSGMLLSVYLDWQFLLYIGLAVAGFIAVYSIWQAFIFNNRNLAHALPTGIGKLLLGLVYVIYWIEFIDPGGKTGSQKNANRAKALIIITLLTPLLKILVNGKEVYEINGWEYLDLSK